MVLISVSAILADRTIRRLTYKLDSDITGFVGDNIVNYDLTRIDSSSPMSTLEIETEQWVHDCCFLITSQPVLRIRLKQDNNYPKITAYLRLRTPLSSLVMTGTGTLTTTNTIQSDSLMIEISGTCKAQMQVEIASKLDLIISGTGQVTMTGNVKGNGYIRLTGIGEFDGRACPMDTVTVDVASIGTAYVVGNEAVDVAVGGVGLVYYHGPLRNQRVNGYGSINTLTNIDGKLSRSSTITIYTPVNYFLILFYYLGLTHFLL
ncbi:unnamed protein product [Adineta ricciae]|uniref:Putative auto-transporter adhesin head GIN domain-containing protein n=1 Tax=Adineta ricciae TaxID=249248 RepID=A0A814NRA1_ADIRI|nr:unnamed protein product [Adineta ricciae]CAF1096778.1 unnamed protein product [Adineta ricciae]